MVKKISESINITELVQKIRKTTLLVVGDIMIDEFIWGTVSRISPEAPVPVVAVTDDTVLLGGAANVVNNVHSLGGRVLLAGVIGDDEMGERVQSLMSEQGIDQDGLIIEDKRPTTVKTRIVAHGQQVVRYDRENVTPVSAKSQESLLKYVDKSWERIDGIIISDYGKGLITPDLMDFIMNKKGIEDKVLAIDPKMNNFELYTGATILTPNRQEAEAVIGKEIRDDKSLAAAGKQLLEKFASKAILVTLGEEGMVLFEGKGKSTTVPTFAKEVYDVTGAGDTVIGALTLSLAAGSSFPEAAVVANYAAGIVVGKVGTATVVPEELKKALIEFSQP